MMNDIGLFLQTAIIMGTPMLYATLGEILAERSGSLNLGVEGMMMTGALAGFLVGTTTNSPLLAVLCAGLVGAMGSMIFAVLTVSLKANQLVAGFVLTIFLSGLANLIGSGYGNSTLPKTFTSKISAIHIPGLSEIPLLGPAIFEQSILVYLGILTAVVLWLYMNKTRFGLSLRVVGENPSFADNAGIPVTLYKYVHIGAGGFLAGVGGSCLTLLIVPRWMESITAGMGWISIALVIFALWSPARAVFGAYFFGALRGLVFKLQSAPITISGKAFYIPAQILDLLPYLMTILVLVLITLGKRKENRPPLWLCRPYFREDR
ncbi:MAG: ABC transporter permease [Clostridiales Family XIII bacterium]|jgi:simple sugar transport system permease protein|nr:ABC transporter permease [Clostridiales Family XIII bacterium]